MIFKMLDESTPYIVVLLHCKVRTTQVWLFNYIRET